MRKNHPKQHTHNWEWRLRDKSGFIEVPNDLSYLKPFSPGGFSATKYWVCVRGGKVKHSDKSLGKSMWREIFLPRDIFIAASGISQSQQGF